MENKKYQIIHIIPEMREMFYETFNLSQRTVQVLDHTSQRPLVVHHVMKQITYVIKGSGNVFLNSQVYPISQGDLIMLDQTITHSFAAYDEELHLVHWHWPNEQKDIDRILLKEVCDELMVNKLAKKD